MYCLTSDPSSRQVGLAIASDLHVILLFLCLHLVPPTLLAFHDGIPSLFFCSRCFARGRAHVHMSADAHSLTRSRSHTNPRTNTFHGYDDGDSKDDDDNGDSKGGEGCDDERNDPNNTDNVAVS